jgi:hypothetical protein
VRDEEAFLKILQCTILADEMSEHIRPVRTVTKQAVYLTACEKTQGANPLLCAIPPKIVFAIFGGIFLTEYRGFKMRQASESMRCELR